MDRSGGVRAGDEHTGDSGEGAEGVGVGQHRADLGEHSARIDLLVTAAGVGGGGVHRGGGLAVRLARRA